jgi:hypothetical protein
MTLCRRGHIYDPNQSRRYMRRPLNQMYGGALREIGLPDRVAETEWGRLCTRMPKQGPSPQFIQPSLLLHNIRYALPGDRARCPAWGSSGAWGRLPAGMLTH